MKLDDLISRAAAIEICKSIVPNTNPDFYNLRSKAGYGSWMHSNGEVCAITNIETKIEALPSVDAVTVVRCKDCMYFRPWRHDRGEDSRCEFWNAEIDAEDYCSQAIYLNNKMDSERRDGE